MCRVVGDFMKEFNKLTKRLLAEGWTVDNYPDYVRIDPSKLSGNDSLNNLGGGFVFKRWYRDEIVYKAGCGKYLKGANAFALGLGIEWSHENNNPVFRCPYDKAQCPHNDSRLHGEYGGGLAMQCFCVCHRTEEPYDYENSIEKANKEREEEIKRKYQEYYDSHSGRICEKHMYYDERKKQWDLRYSPRLCANLCYSQDGYCPILGKQLSKKRGNVYYDVKTSFIPEEKEQRSLFDVEGQRVVNIEKGIRVFDHPVNMDVCEAFVKVEADRIAYNYDINHSFEMKYWNPTWEFEILNIRAESKPSRDLMQDLEDIKAGIHISHASDNEKREKEVKKERRVQAQEKRIAKLEKKLLEVGYENLEEFSVDKVHADKWLSVERLAELEAIRQEKLKEVKPVQINLFDLMGDE